MEIVAVMLGGVLAGYLFRNKNMGFIRKLITVAIWLLLFLLGIVVGISNDIMDNLGTIGWQALVLSIGGVGGSVVLAKVVYHYFFKAKPVNKINS